MKLRHYATLALLPIFLLNSCKSGEGDESEGVSVNGGPSVEKKERPKLSELRDASRELDAYEEKIGYEDTAEIKALDAEQTAAVMELIDLRQNHPKLKEIREEGEEAQTKLMEAVANKDEAGKEKWGPIAGQNSMKRLEATKNIPEIAELERKAEELGKQVEDLRYEIISQVPEGKKLADKLRELNKAYSGE